MVSQNMRRQPQVGEVVELLGDPLDVPSKQVGPRRHFPPRQTARRVASRIGCGMGAMGSLVKKWKKYLG